MSTRKASMVPSEGRRKSIYERKASTEKNALDLPVGMARRPSMDQRRMSMAGSLAGRSGLLSADRNKNVKYENTYKTEPDDRFPIYEAKKIANSVLKNYLDGKEYNKDECQRLTRAMSDRIKMQVKALGYPRFKIVVIVSVGQEQETHPSMSFTSRCMWNDKLDNFAEATFKSRQLYAVALVYATYAD
ncbi:Tctex1 domain-containing protein 1 [Mactra antiquata]